MSAIHNGRCPVTCHFWHFGGKSLNWHLAQMEKAIKNEFIRDQQPFQRISNALNTEKVFDADCLTWGRDFCLGTEMEALEIVYVV